MSEGTYDSNGHWIHTNPVLKPDEIICIFFAKHNADERQWDALDRLRELERENVELKKDKERLDWLIENASAYWVYTREDIDKAMNQPTQ